jgi:DNA-directed RNA polymerase subunit RPC12/RpoP
MNQEKRQCPDCHSPLTVVHLSDLMGEKKEQQLEPWRQQIGSIFDYFNFYVCGQCGRTLVYAGSEAREIAAGGKAKKGGGFLNLS